MFLEVSNTDMAGGTYEVTHTRILESGKEMFLRNGYERTNLRDLCEDAGVTTGAFYRHFKDKEALFSALVEPAVNSIRAKYEAAADECFDNLGAGNMEEVWAVSAEAVEAFIRIIYAHFDEFKLLLCCADGTPYIDFTDRLVERELQNTLRMYEFLDKKHISYNRIDGKKLHMLIHSYFSCIFETVLHDYTQDEALEVVHTLAEFFSAGWRKVLRV